MKFLTFIFSQRETIKIGSFNENSSLNIGKFLRLPIVFCELVQGTEDFRRALHDKND